MKTLLALVLLVPGFASASDSTTTAEAAATLAPAPVTWNCKAPASSFFTNPLFKDIPNERLPVGNVPDTNLTFVIGDDGKLVGELELSGPLEEKVENIESQANLVSGETIGAESFEQAVSYLKTMLGRSDLAIDSYRSYPLPRPTGEIYLVGLDLLSGGEVAKKAVLYPAGEIVGACE